VIAIDLEDGSWQEVGELNPSLRSIVPEGEHRAAFFVVESPDGSSRAFDAGNGEPRSLSQTDWPDVHWKSAGIGRIRWKARRNSEIVDPIRDRVYSAREVGLHEDVRVLVLPGRWLVQHDYGQSWSWFDPDTRAREWTGWAGTTRPAAVLPDGRVLLVEPRREDEGVWCACLLDSVSLERQPLECVGEAWLGPELRSAYAHQAGTRPCSFEPAQIPLLWCWHALYRLEPEAARLVLLPEVPPWSMVLRAGEDGELLLVERDRRLVRLDLSSGERRVLFPRADG
jgi:hypothetical protein